MMYLALIFVPPAYFLVRKKWGGLVLNCVFYGIACFFVLTIALCFFAVPFWMISVGHACFTYRREAVERHADLIATKMAEKLAANTPQNKQP
jgi:hypothetical protein